MLTLRPQEWEARAVRIAACTLALVAGLTACGDGLPFRSDNFRAGPSLIAIDSTILDESDSVFVGKASGFLAAADGRFLIGDLFSRRVLVFGRGGAFRTAIGRRGKAPGEFTDPTWLALQGDSLLYVTNDGNLRIEVFDLRSGEFRWGRRLQGGVSMLNPHDGGLLAGHVDVVQNTSLTLIVGEKDPIQNLGPLPALFRKNPIIPGVFGVVEHVMFHDTLVTAYEVSNRLYLSRLGGEVLDSIEVPVVRRRGARIDLIGRIVDVRSAEAAIYKSSIPGELARLSSGALALVSFDWEWKSSRVHGTGYLSLVDVKNHRACAETRVPGPVDPIPRVAFRGDTLFVLAQEVDGDRPYTVIRSYRIDGTRCRWVSSAD